MDFQFLPDMGRMNGQWPSAARTGYSPALIAAAERAAAMYTLIDTAKLNDVDPQAWLADMLARIADHPAKRIDELLPWNWRRQNTPLKLRNRTIHHPLSKTEYPGAFTGRVLFMRRSAK